MDTPRTMPTHTRPTPLSGLHRTHQEAFLLCWKIGQGLEQGVVPQRIQALCTHFFHTRLAPHFATKEKVVLPVLGDTHPLAIEALRAHQVLTHLFIAASGTPEALPLLSRQLKAYILAVEQELFPLVQQQATEEELLRIEAAHDQFVEAPPSLWPDPFWM